VRDGVLCLGDGVKAASLLERRTPHHSNVFPEDREGLLQVIEYGKTRIPRPR